MKKALLAAAVLVLAAPGAATADTAAPGAVTPTGPGWPAVVSTGGGDVRLAVINDDLGVRTVDAGTAPIGIGPKRVIGAAVQTAPSITADAQGRTDLFYVAGERGAIYWTPEHGPRDGQLLQVPGTVGSWGEPAAVAGPNGRLDVFYLDWGHVPPNQNVPPALMHSRYDGTAWAAPERLSGLGGYLTPAVVRLPNGRLRIWTMDGTNHVVYRTGDTGAWGPWNRIATGATSGGLAATIGFDPATSRQDVFLIGTRGGLYQGAFTGVETPSFSGWRKIDHNGSQFETVAAAAAGPGKLIVYVGSKYSTDPARLFFKQYVNGSWRTAQPMP